MVGQLDQISSPTSWFAAKPKAHLKRSVTLALLSPDLAIVDLSLKEGSGLELIKTIRAAHPAVAVIVLSMHDEKHYAERAIRAGARGYVMKRETTKKIIAAIQPGAQRRLGVSDEVAALVRGKVCRQSSRFADPLKN